MSKFDEKALVADLTEIVRLSYEAGLKASADKIAALSAALAEIEKVAARAYADGSPAVKMGNIASEALRQLGDKSLEDQPE